MPRIALLTSTLAILLSCGASHVAAQVSENPEAAIKASFAAMTEAYPNRNWEVIKTHCTEEGWLQYKRQVVLSTFLWCNPEYPVPLKNRDEIREKVEKAFAENGVSEVHAPNLNAMLEGFDIEAYEAFTKKSYEAADVNLNQSMNHMGLISALTDALEGVSFPQFGDILLRDSKPIEFEIDGNEAFVTFQFDPRDDPEDEDIIVSSQPFIVRFVQVEREWQYDGMDMKRTMQLTRQEFDKKEPLPIDDEH